jgi:hypothetical protein
VPSYMVQVWQYVTPYMILQLSKTHLPAHTIHRLHALVFDALLDSVDSWIHLLFEPVQSLN